VATKSVGVTTEAVMPSIPMARTERVKLVSEILVVFKGTFQAEYSEGHAPAVDELVKRPELWVKFMLSFISCCT
jgi:hypothetical protein